MFNSISKETDVAVMVCPLFRTFLSKQTQSCFCIAVSRGREGSLWTQFFQIHLPQSCRAFTAATTAGDYYN